MNYSIETYTNVLVAYVSELSRETAMFQFTSTAYVVLVIFTIATAQESAFNGSNILNVNNTDANAGTDIPKTYIPDLPSKKTAINTTPLYGVNKCRLYSTDPYIYNKIQDILSYKVKLLEYELEFEEYDMNPLTVENQRLYRGYKWARAYSQHGQTLLSLAFNYGIMSLMTLTLGVENLHIPLKDSPKGCVLQLTEREKVSAVLYLLMRDFQEKATNITLKDQERICHEVVLIDGNTAKFTDECCHIDPITKHLACSTDIINIWLKILFFILATVKFGLLFFGPLYFIPLVESVVKDSIPYVVKLKEPLVKKIFICNSDTHINKTYHKVVDLRGRKGLPKLRESIKRVPVAEPVKVKFTGYDILVNYKRLLVENEVPVGVLSSFVDAFCRCKISKASPFRECCTADLYKSIHSIDKEVTWLSFFRKLNRIIVVLLLPLPFYIRLIIFYTFESEDISAKQRLLDSQNVHLSYDGGIMTHLTPTHPLYVTVYALYFGLFIVFALLSPKKKDHLKWFIYYSFRDLKHMSWIEALGVFVGNMIWPFKRYGILGCIIAPIYWLIIFPISLVVYVVYCLPTFYVPVRLLYHVISQPKAAPKQAGKYKVQLTKDASIHNFETDALMKNMTSLKHSESISSSFGSQEEKKYIKCNIDKDMCVNILLAVLVILTMFGVLLILSECIGFIVELMIFTMMGVIVNAGAVLKYVTLLILVVVYSYDCYNNVGKKYLKLNKALFGELKGRCKDIEKVTSLPSYLQENCGFKSQELSEQADYEQPDGIDGFRRAHWMINDLVLFVDNEDMPRIPRNLFEEVCQINVAGAPGPVHQSLILATQEFLKILLFIFFVFIVVLTFGAVYKVSSTNQMLATLAGGFLPFLMRTFLTPSKPDIELGTVSFKSRLDEIIKNFRQKWPIYDVPFEPWTKEDEKKEDTDGDSQVDKSSTSGNNMGAEKDVSKLNEEDRDKMRTDENSQLLEMKMKTPDNRLIADVSGVRESSLNEHNFDVDILIFLPGRIIFFFGQSLCLKLQV